MTGREMCEKIAAELEKRDGIRLDPLDIWEMSPSAELWPVFDLYEKLFPGSGEKLA